MTSQQKIELTIRGALVMKAAGDLINISSAEYGRIALAQVIVAIKEYDYALDRAQGKGAVAK